MAKFVTTHEALGSDFLCLSPAQMPKTILRYRNQTAASKLGLAEMSDDAWCQHFGHFKPSSAFSKAASTCLSWPPPAIITLILVMVVGFYLPR